MKGHIARWIMIGGSVAIVAGVAGWVVAASRRSQAVDEVYARHVDPQPVS